MTPLPSLVTAGIEIAINRVLRLDPEALARLEALGGKVIAIELRGVELGCCIIPGPGGVQVLGRCDTAPDTTLRGTPLALTRMAMTSDASRLLFSGDVEIRGDVELGQRFRAVLEMLEIDWEEQLSRLTGDMIARKVGNATRGLLQWGGDAADTLRRDLAEWLVEERRAVPERAEVAQFLDQVDVLRADVDRLAARVVRLQQWLRPVQG